MKKGLFLAFVLLLISMLIVSYVQAEEPGQIISNSQDWRDVYSITLYGSMIKKSAGFLVSEKHSTLFLNGVAKGTHIWAISSKKNPYVKGYKAIIEGKGYTAEEFEYDNVNLELAKLSGASSFIIVDDSYGYNAISVAPYSVATKSFVLFADKGSINSVSSYLNTIDVKSVLIYGHVDKEVIAAMKKYNPEIINKDGDRFANNVEIVKKYQKVKGSVQAAFTNGEFIEKEIMSGEEPVVFIGRNNVPDIITDYIKGSNIKVGVLIGNDLVSTATTIRRGLGLSVFVKFAQSARSPGEPIAQVEGLDIFYLPTYNLDLSLQSVKYNSATKQLEVTLRNNAPLAAYFKGTYTVSGGGTSQTVGDIEPVFIDGNGVKTVVYSLGPFSSDELSASVYIIYGESKNSLEKAIDIKLCPTCDKSIQVISVSDDCDVRVDGVSYNSRRKAFVVSLNNPSSADCYADVELVNVIVGGEKKDFGLKEPVHLDAGGARQVSVSAELDSLDLQDNQIVRARAYFGQREASLMKVFDAEFELQVASFADAIADNLSYVLLAVIVAMVAGMIWIVKKKRRESGHI